LKYFLYLLLFQKFGVVSNTESREKTGTCLRDSTPSTNPGKKL